MDNTPVLTRTVTPQQIKIAIEKLKERAQKNPPQQAAERIKNLECLLQTALDKVGKDGEITLTLPAEYTMLVRQIGLLDKKAFSLEVRLRELLTNEVTSQQTEHEPIRTESTDFSLAARLKKTRK